MKSKPYVCDIYGNVKPQLFRLNLTVKVYIFSSVLYVTHLLEGPETL